MAYDIKDFKYIDAHTHFFPPSLFKAIWEYFESPDENGNPRGWNIKYKLKIEELVEFLKNKHISRYTTFNYSHKNGISHNLNKWTFKFTQSHKDAIGFGTCYPSDKNKEEYVRRAFEEYQFFGLKLQLLVQNFYPYDERLFEVYKLVIDHGKWINMHCGTAPYSNNYVGSKHFIKMMDKFPNINIIVAHLGAYEYKEFISLLDKYENLYFDTAMVFIPLDLFKKWKNKLEHPPKEIISSYEDRIIYGSDFPNIPYDYDISIQGLLDLELDRMTYKKIFYENANKIFNLS